MSRQRLDPEDVLTVGRRSARRSRHGPAELDAAGAYVVGTIRRHTDSAPADAQARLDELLEIDLDSRPPISARSPLPPLRPREPTTMRLLRARHTAT